MSTELLTSLNSLIPAYLINSFIFRLIIASVLGALIGFERSAHGRAAGLRTHLLVSLGSAVFMIISESTALSYGSDITYELLRIDPARIAAQIITGIGFLGAGAIIKSGMSIRGLTTAACLWISAGIGMSIGGGYIGLGIVTTIIGLFTLTFLNKAEQLYSKDSYRVIKILTPIDTDIDKLIDTIKRDYLKIISLDKEKNYEQKTMKLDFTIRVHSKDNTDTLSHKIISDLENLKVKFFQIKWSHE